MIKDRIIDKIKEAALKIGIADPHIQLDHPNNLQFGDYSTNIALIAAKQLKKNPLELAESIKSHILPDEIIEQVEVIKPGFINIRLSKNQLLNTFSEIASLRDSFGKNTQFINQKIVIEYTDPNPFKEFHIGHVYTNIVGEALAKLLEASGAQVIRVNYQGDIGLHVAKTIWGLQQQMKRDTLTFDQLGNKNLHDRIHYLGQAYALGSTQYDENEQAKEEIIAINKMVYEKNESIKEIYQTCRQWSLDYFEEMYHILGNNNGKGTFEKYYFESETGKRGMEIVKEYSKKGLFEKSQGAIIFPGEKYGLHNRVFINSLGLPTYETKELGLAITKYEDFKYDQSYIVTGNEINAYFKVLITALKKINLELGEKTKHIGHGMVRLPEGKMSSRTGKVITGEWLLGEAFKFAYSKTLETTKPIDNLPKMNLKNIADIIAIGAIKYAFLKTNIGSDVAFSFDESINFNGNAGPYLQYTYVRCQSILEKADNSIITTDRSQFNEEELLLLRLLHMYPEIVAQAGKALAPHLICNYLYNLAQNFNIFYQKHQILKADEDIKQFRLTLTQAVSQVLKNGLYLLGIETVNKM